MASKWFDISFSVEVDEDVFKQLFDQLSLLICDGDGGSDVADEHYCRRRWVGSYKSTPDVDEDEDEEAGSVAHQVELGRA